MNSPLSVGASVAVGWGVSVGAGVSVSVAVGKGVAVSVGEGLGVAVGSGAPVQAETVTTRSAAKTNRSWPLLGNFNGICLAERTGLRKRPGPNSGRLPTIRIELVHHKPRDTLPRRGRRTQRPEQLDGGLHEFDLRGVPGIVEPQELDDVVVRDWSFHRTLSFVPE